MKIVYIAHPIRGAVKQNLKAITEIAREIMFFDTTVIPFAPYYLYYHALNDNVPEERGRGLYNDEEFFRRRTFDELWVYGPRISSGMSKEIAFANDLGIPVIIKDSRLYNASEH